MWNRLKRLFRSVFGGLIERAEDPELILKQVIRDMNDKVPQMRENVVQVMATEKKLAKEVEILEREIMENDYKVKAAIKQGRDDVARLTSPRCRKSRRRLSARSRSLNRLAQPPRRRRSSSTTTSSR